MRFSTRDLLWLTLAAGLLCGWMRASYKVQQLNDQARHNIECIQHWIERKQIAPVDPHHLMFSIWAATQTYADFDPQIRIVTGRRRQTQADFEAAADAIVRIVLKGCGLVCHEDRSVETVKARH